MTSLGGAPSPCTLGYWWGLEGTELTAFALGCWLCWALGTVLPGHRGTPPPAPPADELGLQAGDGGSGLLSPLFIQYILYFEAAQATARCEYQLRDCPSPPPAPGPGALRAIWEGRVARRGAGATAPCPRTR